MLIPVHSIYIYIYTCIYMHIIHMHLQISSIHEGLVLQPRVCVCVCVGLLMRVLII